MSSPNLHDARLLGMFVSDNKTATVLFRSENGQRHELLLKEVEHLVANDFREGNIVLDVEIYDGESFDSKLLSEIYGKNYLTAHPGFDDMAPSTSLLALRICVGYSTRLAPSIRGHLVRNAAHEGFCIRLLRRQPVDHPCRAAAAIANPIVQPRWTALPEFERVGMEPIATPV